MEIGRDREATSSPFGGGMQGARAGTPGGGAGNGTPGGGGGGIGGRRTSVSTPVSTGRRMSSAPGIDGGLTNILGDMGVDPTAALLQSGSPGSTTLPKKTERKVVLKLELGAGATTHQMGIVANTLYELDKPPELPAKNNQHWSKTDDELYNIAKKAYDDILNQFQMKPQVYRFESTKEKIWADLVRIERDKAQAANVEEVQKAAAQGRMGARKLRRKQEKEQKEKEKAAKEAEIKAHMVPEKITIEEEIATYLDPFDVPLPWVKEVGISGLVTYHNLETDHRTAERPKEEVWAQKVDELKKLTPREDLDGYEYREDLQEKRKRQRIMQDYEKRVLEEIERRVKQPTDLEQVEDCLYFIVDAVTDDETKRLNDIARAEKEKIVKEWHIATKYDSVHEDFCVIFCL
jgi:hypothetical protein